MGSLRAMFSLLLRRFAAPNGVSVYRFRIQTLVSLTLQSDFFGQGASAGVIASPIKKSWDLPAIPGVNAA